MPRPRPTSSRADHSAPPGSEAGPDSGDRSRLIVFVGLAAAVLVVALLLGWMIKRTAQAKSADITARAYAKALDQRNQVALDSLECSASVRPPMELTRISAAEAVDTVVDGNRATARIKVTVTGSAATDYEVTLRRQQGTWCTNEWRTSP